MAENRVIGRGAALPWHLPEDMRHFKRLTTGHTIIMGRRTYDSVGKPLPNRRTVVLTRDRTFAPDRAVVAPDLASALASARGEDEVFVVGGAEIYELALPLAQRIYLTVVHAEVDGDIYFPDFDIAEWTLVSDERHAADQKHAYPFSFRVYERR